MVAPAGTGKSWLLKEFVARSEGPTCTRCLSYGEGSMFWPLAEIAKMPAGIGNDDLAMDAMEKPAALLGPEGRDVADRIAGARSASRTRTIPWRRRSGPPGASSSCSDGRC